MYLYHLTAPDWLKSDSDRLAFHLYEVPPENAPFRNHQPLNDALAANPDKHVYRVFFYHEEATALRLLEMFAYSELLDRVLLRVNSTSAHLSPLEHAKDDKDPEKDSHVWYRVSSTSPRMVNGRLGHPKRGIPFGEIDIRESVHSDWLKLTDWLAQHRPRQEEAASPVLHVPPYDHDGFDAEAYQRETRAGTPADEAAPGAPSFFKRFQVYTAKDAVSPAFSAPWRWLANLYAQRHAVAADSHYCRIDDARRKTTVHEWAKADEMR